MANDDVEITEIAVSEPVAIEGRDEWQVLFRINGIMYLLPLREALDFALNIFNSADMVLKKSNTDV
jgi:hypothetical protein